MSAPTEQDRETARELTRSLYHPPETFIESVAAALQAERERTRGEGWQPIETAPKYPEGATPMLVYGAKRLEWAVAMRDVNNDWLVETCSDIVNIYPPSYWMPLPSPPPLTARKG